MLLYVPEKMRFHQDPLLVFLGLPTLCRALALRLNFAAARLCNANLDPAWFYSFAFNTLAMFAYVITRRLSRQP